MPGLVPGIHVFNRERKTWMAGTSPAMTNEVGCARVVSHRPEGDKRVPSPLF
jgi:hypothetical protein